MKHTLWTRDFTILTAGSLISMIGNTAAAAGMSLLVLDYTGSTLCYALYLFAYTAPAVIMPLLAGPYLDKFSRKQVIYTLDFLSTAVYLVLAAVIWFDLFSFPLLLAGCLLVGAIESVYQVAYTSFYPMLISEGNYTKAYSISSILETLTMFVWPLAVFVYNTVGIVPLFLVNTATFLIAAIAETQIRAEERYTAQREETVTLRSYFQSMKEGLSYLRAERGLLAVTLYFVFSSLSGGATNVVTLPYFRGTFANGEYICICVLGIGVLGRAIGGAIYYKFKYPAEKKFAIALGVYLILSLLEGGYLFLPVKLMMVCCFLTGIGGVTSYNIRISATQSYVPDERKGRFNGLFQMLTMIGTLLGQLSAGALSTVIGERSVVVIFAVITFFAALLLIGGNRDSVKAIYNRDV